MKKGLLIRYRELKEKGVAAGSRVPRILLLVILIAIFLGDVFVLGYVFVPELWAVLTGVVVLICALLLSLILASFPFEKRISRAGESLALVSSVNILGIVLPSFGDQYVNFSIFSLICLGALLLYRGWLAKARTEGIRRGYVVVALSILPLTLAMNEYFVVGGRIPAPFLGEFPLWFFFSAVLFAFSEEAIFRGGVQRNLIEVFGWKGSLLAGAALNASLMVFWGSAYLIALTFGIAVVMGVVFEKSRSVALCCAIRMAEAFWFMLMILIL